MKSIISPRSFTCLGALLLMLAMASMARCETWTIDPPHTAAHFSIQHLMIAQVRGMFPDVQGTVSIEGGVPMAFDVSISASSVNTGVDKRDEHLKSPDFFEVMKYPTMTFKSARVESTGNGFRVIGTLTIKGVSREITAILTGFDDERVDPWKHTRRGGKVEFTLNRQDYNVSWNAPMDGGGFVVGNDVDVIMDIEVVKPE